MLLDDRPAADIFAPPPGRAAVRPRPAAGPADDLPPELAFLLAQGVDPALLLRAARAAARAGVTGEEALFGLGFPDTRYHRLLARHLGVPYLRDPLPLARGGFSAEAVRLVGWAPLAPNPANIGHALAARGEALRGLLADHRFEDRGTYDFALTTRRRFEALLRRRDAAGLADRAADGLAGWDAALSARGGASRRQRWAALAGAAAVAAGFALVPGATSVLASAALIAVFAAAVAQRLLAVAAARAAAPPAPLAGPADRELPVYTVVVPLYREGRVLPRLVQSLDALDYPPAKLDIKVMLEAGDAETAAAAERLDLPPRYDVVVLPPGHPRTKPRALNAALEAARGALVVVYDAEDRPHPGQLRLAAARFAAAPAAVACLQARLTIDHADETWLTRLFALDYAALFHAVMPGLAALGLPVPLGGTSNHFRGIR